LSVKKTEGKKQLERYRCRRGIILKRIIIKWSDTLNQINLYCARNQGWALFKTEINIGVPYNCRYFWLDHRFKVEPTNSMEQILHEKLKGPQLIKKLNAFYVIQIFMTAFTRARHLSLASTMPPTQTFLRFILILSSRYAYVVQVLSVPHATPSKPYMHLFCPPYVLHASSISFFLI
jgi:hypothetical protein